MNPKYKKYYQKYKEYALENREKIREKKRAYYLKNRERFLDVSRKRYQLLSKNCPKHNWEYYHKRKEREPDFMEKIRARSKKRKDRIRKTVLAFYGNKCVCCGESNREFLAIDHIAGNGRRHREEIKVNIYEYIYRSKFSEKGTYQILCHNCNMSKGMYGYCPHKKQ